MLLRKKLFDQLEKASLPCTTTEEASSLLHVAIVGGGPTGKSSPCCLLFSIVSILVEETESDREIDN